MGTPSFFSDQVLRFYQSLKVPGHLPRGYEVLFPFGDPLVKGLMQRFYQKYYRDQRPRILLLGINPGRYGAGVTGINFTAPRQLRNDCGIPHPLGDQSELSAEFIYSVIRAYGGPRMFYRHFFIGAVCPLGFVHKGINKNYYDHPLLQRRVTPFILERMEQMAAWPVSHSVGICIGEGKNYQFLNRWNEKYCWFGQLIPLPHPRFIMQYRSRSRGAYVDRYLETLHSALNSR